MALDQHLCPHNFDELKNKYLKKKIKTNYLKRHTRFKCQVRKLPYNTWVLYILALVIDMQ